MSDNLPILKWKRATLRSNTTRFVTAINEATGGTTPDDLEHFRNRLKETLDHLTSLDDSIHGSLNDVEYATDVETCEVYIDSAKRVIYKAAIDSRLSSSISTMRLAITTLHSHTTIAPTIKLPTIKLNHFRATLSSGRDFGSSFSRPWTQTLLSHRLTSMPF